MPALPDLSGVRTPLALATVITLVFEALFLKWFTAAESSMERIAAGSIAAVVLVVFLVIVLSRDGAALTPNAKALIGTWDFTSRSEHGKVGTGEVSISRSLNRLVLSGFLEVDGTRVGTFSSQVTRVNDNRLIFYYVLRDLQRGENMDAVSVLVFDPESPDALRGDWIVASRTPRHGSVEYTRRSA